MGHLRRARRRPLFLVFFSPVVSGGPTSMFSDKDFAWFPLENPGIISIPVGFFFGWLGTVLSEERDDAKYAELEVRSLTGAGARTRRRCRPARRAPGARRRWAVGPPTGAVRRSGHRAAASGLGRTDLEPLGSRGRS